MALSPVSWSVAELLPHSGPMVLIDDVLGAAPGWVAAGVRIAEDSMFLERSRGVPCWLGIEYMAQTIALYSGLEAKRAGRPVRIGLLLGSRRYEALTDHFALGSYLRIDAREEWHDGHMGVFGCTIEEDGRHLARARLNVFLPPDAMALLARREP
jgi:predicted hotdog family 3-hydroxylacyl-ACP dehydratase